MTNEVVTKAKSSLISFPNAELSTVSIKITEGTTEEQLYDIAAKITKIGTGYQWWVGGMVAFAKQHFKNPEKFLQDLHEMTGLTPGYLHMMGNMHLRFPVRDRFPNLSFHHHMRVSHIDSRAKRIAWLKKAEQHNWSEAMLRDRVPAKHNNPRTRLVLRIWPTTIKDPKFLRMLKQLCETFDITYYVAGKLRAGGLRRSRVTRSLLGVTAPTE